MTLDCTVNHELNLDLGCGITPAIDIDFTTLPTPHSGAPQTLIRATFLVRNIPAGTYQIGVWVEAATSQEGVTRGLFFTATSSLIINVYEMKGRD